MNGPVVVTEVASWWERRLFQRLPWSIYAAPGTRRDPNWVPPILSQERGLLGWAHHPFYENAQIVTLLARRDGRPLGRLAVLVNHVHNRKYNERRGFFGFFECVNDPAVARALFEAGERWLRGQGMTSVRGPVNPSLNYTCGLLVDGFDGPPCFLMTYNPRYYGALLESCGLAKSQDLYAYEMGQKLLEELVRRYKPAVLAALERPELMIRPLDTANFHREIETYLDIYNRSMEGTWGFTPLQPHETRHIAGELRRLIVPQFAVFSHVHGQPVGAMLALLDYNQILRKLNGRLFPLGIVRLMAGRRKITAVRAMAVTMLPAFHRTGLSVVLIDSLVEATKKWGIQRYEFSWVLESNALSRGTLERAGMKISRTYRLYDKAL